MPHAALMDYLDTLPGGLVYRVATETRAAIETMTTHEALQATKARHYAALERLGKL